MPGGSGRYPDPGGAGATVSASVTGSAATSITVSGLDGNNDGDYDIYVDLLAASATSTVLLSINGSTANLYHAWAQIVGASTLTGARSNGTCQVGANLSTGQGTRGWIRLRSKTGGTSAVRGGTSSLSSDVGPTHYMGAIEYLDVTTNITSIGITAAANSLAVGSSIVIRKLGNTA